MPCLSIAWVIAWRTSGSESASSALLNPSEQYVVLSCCWTQFSYCSSATRRPRTRSSRGSRTPTRADCRPVMPETGTSPVVIAPEVAARAGAARTSPPQLSGAAARVELGGMALRASRPGVLRRVQLSRGPAVGAVLVLRLERDRAVHVRRSRELHGHRHRPRAARAPDPRPDPDPVLHRAAGAFGLVAAATMRSIRGRFTGALARTVLFLPQIIPGAAAGVAWVWMYSDNGAGQPGARARGLRRLHPSLARRLRLGTDRRRLHRHLARRPASAPCC